MPAPYYPATLRQDLVGKSGKDNSEIASVNAVITKNEMIKLDAILFYCVYP